MRQGPVAGFFRWVFQKGTALPTLPLDPRSVGRRAGYFFGDPGHTNAGVSRRAVLYYRCTPIVTFTDWRDTMAKGPYKVRRAHPRFSFFADAEVTLGDGTSVRAQLAELSSRGCYIDTLEPIPTRTKLRLRICDGVSTCELDGKVLYLHSGGGFGIFGMGVLFEEMGAEQHCSINGWISELARHSGKDLRNNSPSSPPLT